MKKLAPLFFLVLLLQACATKKAMYTDEVQPDTYPEDAAIDKAFFVVGGMNKTTPEFLQNFEKTIKENSSKEKYILFMGDNVDGKKKEEIEKQLKYQVDLVKATNAKAYFVPGNYEWYYDKNDGLEDLEDYLEKQLDTDEVLTPNNGCPLESIEIGDDIQLLVIDSQWYIQDWDKFAKMNDKCEIKSREKLMLEIEGEVKKNANKLILVAFHHPTFTNGFHGGRFSFRDHIFPLQGPIPLPGVGTLITEIRSQGAVSNQDRFNNMYDEFATQLKLKLDQASHRILMISGHELNLQYIEQGNFKQLISSAAGETRPVSISDNGLFSYGKNGFAVVEVHTDGSVWSEFYESGQTSKKLFCKETFKPIPTLNLDTLPKTFPKTFNASVYELDEVEKSDFFQSFWGDHYREVYGIKVAAPTAVLDTLYGGLKVVRPGGGNQTKSLRLETEDGKEYNMRGLRKSAVQFLEKKSFQGVNGDKYFTNTVPEDIILDFYTAAHPYAAFAIPTLAEAAGVYYTTPELYYVPQQKALGKYNEEYGNQLYMIVERPAEEFNNRKSFGYPDDIESTDDLLKKLREDEDHVLNEETYIRARIFDMLIGDWDRHSDQWRWAEFDNEEGKKEFVPIPRDRDQVFANFDGSFLNFLRKIMGSANQFGVYGPDIKDLEWFNAAGIKLDRALVKRSDKEVWLEQAQALQNSIVEKTINDAFAKLPQEVQDKTIDEIKTFLLQRKDNLVNIVDRYYDVLMQFQMLTGTDKDDYFEIERFPNGKTQIIAYRIKDGEKGDLLFKRTFDKATTKEIWLYGLDDDDVFEVNGDAKKAILLRIVGGQNKDTYVIKEGKRVKVYDRRSKDNEIKEKGGAFFRFNNFYEANLYDYQRKKTKSSGLHFNLTGNPDVGTALTLGYEKQRVDFIANPYGQRFNVLFTYESITQGIDTKFEKRFAAVFDKVNLLLEGRFTSKNHTENFFGFGNETENLEDDLSLDYNRVNLEIYSGGVGFEKETIHGNFFQLKYNIFSVETISSGANFAAASGVALGERKTFGIPNFTYEYKNFDDETLPTKGMLFATTLVGIDPFKSNDATGFAKGKLRFYNSLLSNNRLILETEAKTHLQIGEEVPFYLSPSLGGDSGLRSYRNERFTGNQLLAGSGNLSYRFQEMKTFLFPLSIVVFGGYDIGRVWAERETSDQWHQSYGGGLRLQWTSGMAANIQAFTGEEGGRLQFGFNFKY